jgi:creatinine amidohydrolase
MVLPALQERAEKALKLYCKGEKMKTIRMEDMTWPVIKEALAKGYTTAVIGIGSTEQHGPHLPTKTDTLIGDAIAHGVAAKLGNALQAQTIRVGCSDHHLAFPGTISLRFSTLKAIIDDYVTSLEKHGFKTIILLPSHGGNFAPVRESIDELNKKHTGLKIIGYTDLQGFVNFFFKISAEFGINQEEAGAHAGETETSFILFLEENLVEKERFTPGYLGPLGEKEVKIVLEKGMPSLSEKGILGDPTKATSEKGCFYLEKTVDFLVREIKKQL